MAVILGKEKDFKDSQEQPPKKKEDKKEETEPKGDTKKEGKEDKKSGKATNNKPEPKPIPTTMKEIRAEYEQMLKKIIEGKADKELYERYYQLKVAAEKIGATIEETPVVKQKPEKEKDPESDVLEKVERGGLDRKTGRKPKAKKNKGGIRKMIEFLFDQGKDELDFEDDDERNKTMETKPKAKTKPKDDPFHTLTSHEREEQDRRVQEEVEKIEKSTASSVKNVMKEMEKE